MPYNITANVKRSTMSATVTFSINLPFRITREEKWFVAWCPLLDVSSAGKSKEKALAMLSEAIGLFLTESLRMGTLERVLKESGFVKAVQAAPKPRQQQVSVPLTRDLSLKLAECLA